MPMFTTAIPSASGHNKRERANDTLLRRAIMMDLLTKSRAQILMAIKDQGIVYWLSQPKAPLATFIETTAKIPESAMTSAIKSKTYPRRPYVNVGTNREEGLV